MSGTGRHPCKPDADALRAIEDPNQAVFLATEFLFAVGR